IGFHVICVLSRDSLSYPDAIYRHLAELAPTSIGFNIEEVEADHSHSSLEDDDQGSIESKFRSFVARVVDLAKRTPRGPRIREVDAVRVALEHPAFGKITSNSQNRPGRILNVAWDGTFATFSPELLGARHRRLGDLSLGNILFDPLPPDED